MPVTAKDIAEETQKDKLLSQILKFVQSGWLIHVRNPLFRLYFHMHIELSVASECLFWGLRVIKEQSTKDLSFDTHGNSKDKI